MKLHTRAKHASSTWKFQHLESGHVIALYLQTKKRKKCTWVWDGKDETSAVLTLCPRLRSWRQCCWWSSLAWWRLESLSSRLHSRREAGKSILRRLSRSPVGCPSSVLPLNVASLSISPLFRFNFFVAAVQMSRPSPARSESERVQKREKQKRRLASMTHAAGVIILLLLYNWQLFLFNE